MRLAIAAALATTLLLSACPAMTGSKVPKKATGVSSSQSKPSPKPADKSMLSGLLKMDAHYVISAGGGNVISAGGGNVISAGGGNVISAGGGNVISAGGGNVISAGGGNYRLAAADVKVPVGTILPAKGMVVVPVSLVTGKPVGEAVFTDERGHYEIAIPKGMAENVRIVAAVPGKSATDPIVANRRLQYAVVAAPDAGEDVTIDEDTALITRYLRVIIRHQTRNSIQASVWTSDEQAKAYDPATLKLRDKAKAVELIGMPEDRQLAVYERFTDILMASAKLDTLKNDSGKPIVPMLVGMLRDIREAATTKLIASPTFFAEQDYIKNQSGEGCVHEIVKPADVGDFLVFKHLYRADLAALKVASEVAMSLGLASSQNAEFLSAALAIQSSIKGALKDPALTDSLIAVMEQAETLPVAPAGSDCN
ncbi:hypothetical protein D3C72_650030 [compost metagenome]